MAAKRITFFLPNTFTALNMACGFLSCLLSFKGDFYLACLVLLLGAIFDLVDGRIARLTGTQSQFGEQFDSMSDLVSFGVAPAILVYNRFFLSFGRIGIVISFVFLLCGALRLARFNANIEKVGSDYFQGLPIPVGALGLVGYTLFSIEYDFFVSVPILAVVYTLIFATLMISNVPFVSFKKSSWVKRHKKAALISIFIILGLVFTFEKLMVGILVTGYVIGSIGYFFKNKGKIDEVFEWKNEHEGEN